MKTATRYWTVADYGVLLEDSDLTQNTNQLGCMSFPGDPDCPEVMNNLGLAYIDLYLVHWPKPEHTEATWRAMEEIQQSGKARAIGVSNFLPDHLDQLAETATVLPSINQITCQSRSTGTSTRTILLGWPPFRCCR